MKKILTFVCLLPLVGFAYNRSTLADDPAHGLPLKPERTIDFTTQEGTWMSLDVSPDGQTLIFDMLGDIYTLPIAGGSATRLTPVALAVARHPRFSPDGTRIAFVSDADGTIQAWVMQRDGSNPRRVSSPDVSRFGASGLSPVAPIPVWTPDGTALVLPESVDGKVGLVRYALEGGAATPVLHTDACDVSDAAAITPDAKIVYAICRAYPDVSLATVNVRSGGLISLVKMEKNVPAALLVSPDGKWLIYPSAKEVEKDAKEDAPPEHRVILWRRDLSAPGTADTKLAEIGQSIQDQFASVHFPGFAFTPDSKALIVSSDGAFARIDAGTGAITPIHFTAQVHKALAPLTLRHRRLDDAPLTVRQVLEPNFSHDAGELTYTAVGKVWISSRGAAPRRLSNRPLNDQIREFDPVFSPDDKWIAFCTWSEAEGGQVWKVAAVGGTPILLTKGGDDPKRAYGDPRWTPDGKRLAIYAANISFNPPQFGSGHRSFEAHGSVAWMDADGGPLHVLPAPDFSLAFSRTGYVYDLSFNADATRLFYWDFDPEGTKDGGYILRSVGLEAKDVSDVRNELKVLGYHPRGELSPDGKWLAAEHHGDIVLVPMPAAAASAKAPSIVLGENDCAVNCTPVTTDPGLIQITTEGGLAPKWSSDGQWLSWHYANTVFRARLQDLIAQHRDAQKQSVSVKLSVPLYQPEGSLLLRGARIVTMAGDQVIDHGDILLTGRRIKSVGPSGSVSAPKDAVVMDVSGKTIAPGFVGLQETTFEASPLTPFSDPENRQGLDVGITTAWTPGWGNQTRLGREEARAQGAITEKRIMSVAGDPLLPTGDKADTAADVFSFFQHLAALDPRPMAETYVHTTRLQHQWALQAAAKLGIAMSSEGGDYHYRVGELLDGFALLEHHYNGVRYRNDMLQLWLRSGTAWNSDGGKNTGENSRDLIRAGAPIGVSEENSSKDHKYGAVSGMLANYASAPGETPLEALRSLTLNGARALGLDADLGSIEAGKIADLVIFDENPLDDPNKVTTIRYVVQDGFVYETPSLKPVPRITFGQTK